MYATIRQDRTSLYIEFKTAIFRPGFPPRDWLFEPTMNHLTSRMRDSDLVYRKVEAKVGAEIPEGIGTRFKQGQKVFVLFSADFHGWLWLKAEPITEVWFWSEGSN